jgi:Flp pilus assembly protein TadG
VSNKRFPPAAVRQARRAIRDERGSAAVEFALVLPAFLAFLFGFFEFCWAQNAEAAVRTALEQAARILVITPTTSSSTIQSFVQGKVTTLAQGTVTVTTSIATGANGKVATLTATYPHTIGIPGMATYNITYQTTVQAGIPTF